MSLASKLGKAVAHPILGTLPEQQWLEDHISWYDSRTGVFFNAFIETVSGIVYTVSGFGSEGLLLTLDGLIRIKKDHFFSEEFKGISEPKGTYALEIPWRIVKGGYNLSTGCKFYLDNRHWV